MGDFPFTPTGYAACPHCDERGTLTGLLGPANCARCKNEDCPIRDYWTIADKSDFGIEGEPVGDIEFDD